MLRAATIFTLFVAMLAAGAVLAQSVQPVRAIRAQTVLAPEDLTLVEESVPGAVGAVEFAAGQEAKVALYPGRPILESQIGAPALVERNAVVRMTFVDGPLRIVTDGRALDRAAAGETVRVMNLASRQTVTGTVAADGSIEVGQQTP
jgi:flagella basal body P-ring formation protein FlgA